MTDISRDAAARREAARDRGRFGVQEHSAPEVAVPEQKASGMEVQLEARAIEPGMTVLTEMNTQNSPFWFALRRSRDLRRRWVAAGMPQMLEVTGRRRAPEDGHTDDEITFDLGGEPLVLTFHRDSILRILD